MPTPENRVKTAIKTEMSRRGWYWSMPVQGGYGAATLDFLCCMPVIIRPQDVGQRMGLFVGIETKRGDGPGRPTPRQAQTINAITAAGGFGLTAQSWEDVARVLKI